MPQDPLLQRLLAAGEYMLPVSGKLPALKTWEARPTEPPTADQLEAWERGEGLAREIDGWAIRCGGPRRLVCLDIEGTDPTRFAEIAARYPANAQYETPSGGRHIWLRVPDGDMPRPRKLTKINTENGVEAIAEVRAAGQYAVVIGPNRQPPSDLSPYEISHAEYDAVCNEMAALGNYALPAELAPSVGNTDFSVDVGIDKARNDLARFQDKLLAAGVTYYETLHNPKYVDGILYRAKCPVHAGERSDEVQFGIINDENPKLLGKCHSCNAKLPDIGKTIGFELSERKAVPLDVPAVFVEEDSDRGYGRADLTSILDGTFVQPEPGVGIARSDGLQLLYPGKEHSIVGEMESGKSWIALACCAREINEGNNVVYIHFEESLAVDSVERLLALGVAPDRIRDHFWFAGPYAPVNEKQMNAMVNFQPTLVILDGVNEAMALHGQDINAPEGTSNIMRTFARPFTEIGAATLSLDHVVKDRDNRGRYAFGSVHKFNRLNGAAYVLELAQTFGRNKRGVSKIYVSKDRPGFIRQHGEVDRASSARMILIGSLVVDDDQWEEEGGLRLSFDAPAVATRETAPTLPPSYDWLPSDGHRQAARATLAFLAGREERANTRLIESNVPGRAVTGRQALALLLDRGLVSVEHGTNRAMLYAITDAGREAL